MSSFQLHHQHIAAMVGTFLAYDRDSQFSQVQDAPRTAAQLAMLLAKANADCLERQYREVCIPAVPTWDEIEAWMEKPLTPVEACVAVRCYDYQCEHIEEISPEAKNFCDRLVNDAFRRVPGYDAAPWGIDGGPDWLAKERIYKGSGYDKRFDTSPSIGTATILTAEEAAFNAPPGKNPADGF